MFNKSVVPFMKSSATVRKNRIALVLQGGGALGAYQAGVYQALHEHGLAPDWVVGTSIGAINAALIAGNATETRMSRLREFWDTVAQNDGYDMRAIPDAARRFHAWFSTLGAFGRGIRGFFSPRILNPFAAGMPVAPEEAGFYDTRELAITLQRLVDFNYLSRARGMRLTVGAVKVTSGELVNFDSAQHALGVEHIMASGALPPGFPPVRVNGELYWDGGLYSNTPLETVLADEPHVNTLCFMVDLWQAAGPEPTTLEEVQTRQKDIMYASRSKRHIDAYIQTHNLQRVARSLYEQLPASLQRSADEKTLAALGCYSTLHVVRLSYPGQDWQMASKDINFSRGSINWRWEQGYRDASRAIGQANWLATVTDGSSVVLHES
jgi:NTE family protein